MASLTYTTFTKTVPPVTAGPPVPSKRSLNITDVKPMIETLVKEMLESELLTEKFDIINAWQLRLTSIDLTTTDGLKRASIAICFLLCNVIHPLLLGAGKTNESISTRIYPFNKKLDEIWSIILPDKAHRKEMLASYISLARERAAEKKAIEKVKSSYASLEKQLNEMTEMTLSNFTSVFEKLKAELLALVEKKASYSETAQKLLSDLTEKIAKMEMDLSTHAENAATVGVTLLSYKNGLLATVKTMRNITDGV